MYIILLKNFNHQKIEIAEKRFHMNSKKNYH